MILGYSPESGILPHKMTKRLNNNCAKKEKRCKQIMREENLKTRLCKQTECEKSLITN